MDELRARLAPQAVELVERVGVVLDVLGVLGRRLLLEAERLHRERQPARREQHGREVVHPVGVVVAVGRLVEARRVPPRAQVQVAVPERLELARHE